MANNIINRHSTVNVDSSSGVVLSANNSQINHTGVGTFQINSLGDISINPTGTVNISKDLIQTADITLGNNDDVVKYFYIENSSTNTKHWRVSADSNGTLNFEKYNGTSWVNKMNLQ